MLARLAREAARRFGDRIAYVAPGGWSLTYGELDLLSDEVAAGLAARGIGEGAVVALVLPTLPEYVIAYLAAAKVGAITAGVNIRLAPPEREAVLARANPDLVLATPALAPAGDWEVGVVEPARSPDEVLPDLRTAGGAPPELPDNPERPVVIVFTSGTTGIPKGAVFTARQLEFITGVDTGWQWGTGGGGVAATSLAHLGPMTKLGGKLVQGGITHLMEEWRAAEALRIVAEHRLAVVGGIPTQVALMLRDPHFDDYDLSCVKAVVMGGGPATASLVREARERFRAPVLVRYSCTEAGIGTGTTADDPPEDAEVSVGRPHPGVELEVRGEREALPPSEVGEVCLRSDAVMSRYWRDPEATRETLTEDGFVRTGDLGWVDERGRLHLVGRTREMYVRGGYNVSPAEVEGVLAEHPQVAEVAIVPRPDEVMGEVGVAVVVSRDRSRPPTLDSLRAFAADRLAAHKLPEDLVVVDRLPLTAMDKVDRRALVELVARRVAG